MKKKDRAYYFNKFKKFPDVVELKDFCIMLGDLSDKCARKLIREQQVKSFLISAHYGYRYMIPKEYIVDYLLSKPTK